MTHRPTDRDRSGGRSAAGPPDARELVFHLIPHTHWDREWYLPRAAMVARLVPMLDDLISRLEAEPSLTSFLLDGQTILLEDYLAVRPEREAAVRALVSAGRLETGPWYVLADEFIPASESLVRNLLIGGTQARRLGRRMNVLYSPDAFGHPASLPSLAHEFGLPDAVVWRGLRTDRDIVRWRGADRGDLLVYHLPPAGYEIGAALSAHRAELLREWPAVRDTLVGRRTCRHVAVFVGADHHSAHAELPRLRQSLAALEPAAEVRLSGLTDYFAAVRRESLRPAEVRGELRAGSGYTWSLQGVHATRAPLKRRNAKCELWLTRCAEPLAALARYRGGTDRTPLLLAAWRTLVQGHFHDTLGGCAADAVADEQEVRLAAVAAMTRELVRSSVHELLDHDPDAIRDARDAPPMLVLWNPAARPRGGIVIADVTVFRHDILVGPPSGRTARSGPGYQPFALRSAAGDVLPVQVLEIRRLAERRDAARHYPDLDLVDAVRIAFAAPTVPGLGSEQLRTAPVAAPGSRGGVTARRRSLENELLTISVALDGTLTLTDRERGVTFPGLLAVESQADGGDAYTFAPFGSPTRPGPSARTRVLAKGPLVGEIETRWETPGLDLRMRITLRAGERLALCVLDYDTRAPDRRLRLCLPLPDAAGAAIAGGHFGGVSRLPEHAASAPAEATVTTAPAHRYVAAAGEHGGLAVMAPGFFEYEWSGAELFVTVVRSIGELSRGGLRTRPGHAGWATPIPGAQCLGRDRVELALAPIGPTDLDDACLARSWEDAMLPLAAHWLREAMPPAAAWPSVSLTGDGLTLSAVKPADDGDGIILRCYNARDVDADGAWRITPASARVERTSADERPGTPVAADVDGVIAFSAGPHEIVSHRVR